MLILWGPFSSAHVCFSSRPKLFTQLWWEASLSRKNISPSQQLSLKNDVCEKWPGSARSIWVPATLWWRSISLYLTTEWSLSWLQISATFKLWGLVLTNRVNILDSHLVCSDEMKPFDRLITEKGTKQPMPLWSVSKTNVACIKENVFQDPRIPTYTFTIQNDLQFELQTVTRGDSVDQKWSNLSNPESLVQPFAVFVTLGWVLLFPWPFFI